MDSGASLGNSKQPLRQNAGRISAARGAALMADGVARPRSDALARRAKIGARPLKPPAAALPRPAGRRHDELGQRSSLPSPGAASAAAPPARRAPRPRTCAHSASSHAARHRGQHMQHAGWSTQAAPCDSVQRRRCRSAGPDSTGQSLFPRSRFPAVCTPRGGSWPRQVWIRAGCASGSPHRLCHASSPLSAASRHQAPPQGCTFVQTWAHARRTTSCPL